MNVSNFNFSSYWSRHTYSPPTCIDLFCGAGGLSLGFCQAGGVPIAAVDSDRTSTATYQQMFPTCQEVYCGKIEDWCPSLTIGTVDVVIGGPPCQGFSLARGFRFVDDPRNRLYKDFVRLVDYFQPKWIVMENVEGIINIGKGCILQQIYEDFASIGYWLDCKVINMADYGVPQSRKRAIFVGSRVANSFKWPEPTHFPQKKLTASSSVHKAFLEDKQPYRVVLDALGDLPWPMGKYFSHRANSQMRGPRNRSVDSAPAFTLRIRGDEFALCQYPADGAFVPGPLPDVDFVYRPTTNLFQDLMREVPPPWISGYKPPLVCDDKPIQFLIGTRRLAVREQARLQAFPDWFSFTGTPYSQGKQIGNAVPPLFARQLFEAIFQHLSDSKGVKRQRRSQTKRSLQEATIG